MGRAGDGGDVGGGDGVFVCVGVCVCRGGGPQGFGDSWHDRERGRERWDETGRRRSGKTGRDNVIRPFDVMRIFMRVFI